MNNMTLNLLRRRIEHLQAQLTVLKAEARPLLHNHDVVEMPVKNVRFTMLKRTRTVQSYLDGFDLSTYVFKQIIKFDFIHVKEYD